MAQGVRQVALPVLRIRAAKRDAAVTIQLALLLCVLPALPLMLIASRSATYSVHDGGPTRADRTVSALLIAAVIVALVVMAAVALTYR